MLNISQNKILIKEENYPALRQAQERQSNKLMLYLLAGLLVLTIGTLFLPWTQNIISPGKVTTLRPNQRPQTVQSVIAGRIEEWFVQEGDRVNRGDTIIFISEIKDDYFDPDLVQRTEDQILAKEASQDSYSGKVGALTTQLENLELMRELKLQQAKNKVQQGIYKVTSDSMDLEAAIINRKIADQQFVRQEKLYNQGLRSRTELDKRELALQKAEAELVTKRNKLLASKNELINARVELSSIDVDYQKQMAKTRSERFTALSSQYDTEATVTKMQNQLANYNIRKGYYYITAPQDGYITQAIRTGIGETIKEGSQIVTIMPADYELAVEMFVRPLDLPLLDKGQEVRIRFDGWPAIVFSGWPNTSIGTYGGLVFAIDNFAGPNGMYRVLVSADPKAEPWPEPLRPGGGSVNMLLLKDVPIWYEVWRQINGFPADYYKPGKAEKPVEK